MFKGRLSIWGIVIGICLLIQLFFVWMPTWFETSETTAYGSISSDTSLNELLKGYSGGDYELNVKTDAEYIFADSGEEKEGYIKYENALSSPLVFYMNNVCTDVTAGFEVSALRSDVYLLDLSKVLNAMEKGDDWASLGVDEQVMTGKISLIIPNERTGKLYTAVEDLFYKTLNNSVDADEEARKELKPRVDKLLSQCEKVGDILSAINTAESNEDYTKVFIGPEYVYKRGTSLFRYNYSNSGIGYRLVYIPNPTYITADLYVADKGVSAEDVTTEPSLYHSDVEEKDTFMDSILDDNYFYNRTGWRVKDATYATSSNTFLMNP